MYQHGYLVKYMTPSYGDLHWQPATADNLPPHYEMVWVFIPEIGNEDEGYGHIMLARWKNLLRDWYDEWDEPLRYPPVFWAKLWRPENSFVPYDTPEEARASLAESRDQIVNRTGPWSSYKQTI